MGLDSTTQVITTLILVLALTVSVIVTQFARRRRDLVALRAIPAYDALPLWVGASIEADRPLHVSLAGVGIGGSSTLLTLAGNELYHQTANRAAIGDRPPLLTASDPSAIPLVYGTLRRAYADRGRLDRAQLGGAVRWYPTGPRSLAFAAALTATLGDEQPFGSLLMGSFGSELALVLDAAARRHQATIATSDQPEGQAVAFALADHPLIGEEIFTAGAYLGGDASQIGSVVTLDVLRWLLIVGILAPTIVIVGDELLGGAISRFLAGLFAGGS